MQRDYDALVPFLRNVRVGVGEHNFIVLTYLSLSGHVHEQQRER